MRELATSSDKCNKPLFGNKVRIVTVQNTYLSISGIEVWTAQGRSSSSSSFSYSIAPNTKVGFNTGSCKQSTNYNRQNSYPCSNAFVAGGGKFTHTVSGVGQWWEVGFNRAYAVDRVRVLNRRDCCGARLDRTKVFIGNQYCGAISGKGNGQWYTVKCAKPVIGRKVRLVSVQNTYLSISGFEVYTGTWTGSVTRTSRTRRSMRMGGSRTLKVRNIGMYLKNWCGHKGSITNWADIDGDGKADILCDDSKGRHWA
jgi:hypothetical protein